MSEFLVRRRDRHRRCPVLYRRHPRYPRRARSHCGTSRHAGAVREAVAGVPAPLVSLPERPGKWSMLQVAQHLADAELVGAFRYRMILAHDRPSLQGYDQDRWAERLRYAEADLAGALEQFGALRAANLRLLDRPRPPSARGSGSMRSAAKKSIDHLLRMYAGHDLVHLRQLMRIQRAVAPAGT